MPSVRRPLLPSYGSGCLSEKQKKKKPPTNVSAADFKCDVGTLCSAPCVVDGCVEVSPPSIAVVLEIGLGLETTY